MILEEYINRDWPVYVNAKENFTPFNRIGDDLWKKKMQNTIFGGKLQHYMKIDEDLDLPPGTTKKFLIEVSRNFGLETTKDEENIVAFIYNPDKDPRD